MEIKSARFVISNTDVRKCPEGDLPEYAFIGRSNVGKSSLINMLTNQKGLAMTSQTPGKTLLINHFLINDEWYLVDLPGYGYAQRGQEARERLRRIIESYALYREQLTKGASIRFQMSDTPNTGRGTADADRPYSFSLAND